MDRALALWLPIPLIAGLACAPEPLPEPIRPVRSVVVGDASALEGRWWPGRAKATLEVDLGFEVSGQLQERAVDVGDEVKAGDILARLDARDYENSLARARAEELRAKAYYDRVAEAARTGAVAKQEVTDARARYDQASAQVRIRQKALDDTRMVAPFDGTVSQTFVDNFQNVRTKQPVIRLLDVSRIEMVINIPEGLINLVPYARNIRTRFDALPGALIPAEIKEIGNEASEATRTYPVTLIMDPAGVGVDLKPGMAGETTADIVLPEELRRDSVEVPASALFSADDAAAQQSFVWVVDETTSTVQRRQVTPLELTPRGGSLVEGLEPGTRIVTAGVHSLREGLEVRYE